MFIHNLLLTRKDQFKFVQLNEIHQLTSFSNKKQTNKKKTNNNTKPDDT